MRARAIVAGLLLVVACAGCSSKPVARAGRSSSPIDETIAPQHLVPSGVELTISPAPARSGAVTIRTRSTNSEPPWTAAHVWLDKQTARGWETVWMLDTDAHSVAIEDFRRGAVPLNTLGVRVPGSLALTLSPAPPTGRYRVRVGVFAGRPESEGGSPQTWAIGTIEVG